MARLRYNGLSTTLGGSLTNVATSVTFAAALTHSNGTNVPTIVSPDYIPLAILGATGHLSEIVYLTAYTAGATTGTITRGVEGTTGAAHSNGDVVTGAALVADSAVYSGIYGDGSDGNVTITTTVTLTRDMFYDTLTVNSPGILKPNGWRVFAKTAINVGSGGAIQTDGNPGVVAAAGAALTAAALGGSSAGGAGNVNASGSNGGAAATSIGGASGAGGTGTSGTGGSARPATAPTTSNVRAMPFAAMGLFWGSTAVSQVLGGAGGNGGGGDASNAGGGGGGGGGVMILNARAISNSGTITCTGGAGGNPAAGNTGGGGGGGGGGLIVNTSVPITGSAPTAAGGAGGTKQGTGTNGSAGSSGNAIVNVWV